MHAAKMDTLLETRLRFEYRLLGIPGTAAALGGAWLGERLDVRSVFSSLHALDAAAWAGWAQAVGTVAAIAFSVGIGWAQIVSQRRQYEGVLNEQRAELARARKRLIFQRAADLRAAMAALLGLHQKIALQFDPDDGLPLMAGRREVLLPIDSPEMKALQFPRDILLDIPAEHRAQLVDVMKHIQMFIFSMTPGVFQSAELAKNDALKAAYLCMDLAEHLERYALVPEATETASQEPR